MPKTHMMELFVAIVKNEKPLTVFTKNLHRIYLKGSNYASFTVSFSYIVTKITCEDTEAEVEKYFFWNFGISKFRKFHWKYTCVGVSF